MTSPIFERYHVLVVPGWQNSGPEHWQSRWQDAHPAWQRVQQADWLTPSRAAIATARSSFSMHSLPDRSLPRTGRLDGDRADQVGIFRPHRNRHHSLGEGQRRLGQADIA